MRDFGSFVSAAETTFGMITGKFDFDGMVRASPILGPIGFFVFVLVASIVLINIFLTLIISAFETVKHDVMKQSNEYEIVDFMMKKLKEMIGIDTTDNNNNAGSRSQSQKPSTDENMVNIVGKVDKFLHFLDTFYYDGRLTKSASRDSKSTRVSSAFTRQRRYGWRGGQNFDNNSLHPSTDEPLESRARYPTQPKIRNTADLETFESSSRVTPILNWREIENDDNDRH